MASTFIGAIHDNFRVGRPAGLRPDAIVLHRTGGSREAWRVRFNTPSGSQSAHYVVARDGTVDQFVRETDTAFHAGLVVGATWSRLRPNVNPNFYTIGIEAEGAPADDWPAAQVDAIARLAAEVAVRWQFPVDAERIIAHSAIRPSSRCPGDSCPVLEIVAAAQAAVRGTLPPGLDAATTDPMELETRPPIVAAAPATGGPPIDRTTFVLPPKEFAGEITRKDLIVLHFTAGTTARSAFDTWRRDPLRVATAYLVDVDGTIYEVFPPESWAAHLGVKGTNNAHDKRSIGIEIANVGPLQRATDDPSVLNWWPRKSKDAPEFTTRFCTLDESDRYVAAPYRRMTHFAAFPPGQVDAAASLVRYLCDRFSIVPTLPSGPRRFDCDPGAFASYTGVCTHANFRADKWDIGPAFPWDRLSL